MELELRFKQLQEEKAQLEAEFDNRDSQSLHLNQNIQATIHKLQRMVAEKEKEVRDIDASVYAYKTILGEKEIELGQLAKEQEVCGEELKDRDKEMGGLEEELEEIRKECLEAEREVEDLVVGNEKLNGDCAELADKAKSTEQDVVALKRRIEECEMRLEITRRQKLKSDLELETSIKAKQLSREETDRLDLLNGREETEVRTLAVQADDLEARLIRSNQQYDDSTFVLNSKDKEHVRMKALLNYAEERDLAVQSELQKAQLENSTLQRLLDQYREDINFQKKLHEIESVKKKELEAERRRLEGEAAAKEMEARKVREQLEKVKDTQVNLLEDRAQLGEELDALKQHAEVLESQNVQLHRELDSFVDTDEAVRNDLDRKSRVEYIKHRNEEELRRSAERVRKSISPERLSSSKREHSSPGKY